MQTETILLLLGFALLADLALLVASPGPVGERIRRSIRRSPGAASSDAAAAGASAGAGGQRETDVGGHAAMAASLAPSPRATWPLRGRPDVRDATAHQSADSGMPDVDGDLRPAALSRVSRVATWVFLFAAVTIVAVTDLWADRKAAILFVLGAAAVTLVVLDRVVRGRIPDPARLAIEGATGLGFAGVLIALTGGALSPFAFTLPLIVVGAALVVTPSVALALTAVAGAVYIAAIAVAAADNPAEPTALIVATAGINLTALCLVAYVGMAIGREQRRARLDAHRLATEDPLTGLRTRPSLFAALERELARSKRTGRSFCLLMIDLDELKTINDHLGHLHGDRALRLVGDVIRNGIRTIDTGARFGGDEFVVLLPETDPTGGWVLAEKIRQGVAEADLTADGEPVPTSVSVGLVTYPDDGETVGGLLERADAAMYRSKRAGRDRVTGVPVMGPDARLAGRRSRPV